MAAAFIMAFEDKERKIIFPDGHRYAVLTTSYYGNWYTTYRTEEEALAAYEAAWKDGKAWQIMNSDGCLLFEYDGQMHLGTMLNVEISD